MTGLRLYQHKLGILHCRLDMLRADMEDDGRYLAIVGELDVALKWVDRAKASIEEYHRASVEVAELRRQRRGTR